MYRKERGTLRVRLFEESKLKERALRRERERERERERSA